MTCSSGSEVEIWTSFWYIGEPGGGFGEFNPVELNTHEKPPYRAADVAIMGFSFC